MLKPVGIGDKREMDLFFLLLVALVAYKAETASREADRYTINLDHPPSQRWSEVVLAHKSELEAMAGIIDSGIPPMLQNAFSLMTKSGIENYVPYPYNEEIEGVAKLLDGVTTADLLLLNFLYELTAFGDYNLKDNYKTDALACTSIVAETMNGSILHGRNMDYNLQKYLANITVTVDFQTNGNISYTGTTFAGYVGLITGQKPYKYTISLNQRDEGQLWMNVLQAWIYGFGAAPSLSIRDVLAQDDLTFESAVETLSTTPLIASCYLIVGGMTSGEGVVITRSRSESVSPERINTLNKVWYVLQTNYDHWTTPPPSDDRRDPGIEAMESMTRANLDPIGLYNVLSTPPVLNNITTYTVIMSAANPLMYTTWIR